MQTHHLRFYQAACNGAHTPPVLSSPAAHHSIHLLALLSACHYKLVIFHPVIARPQAVATQFPSGGGVDAAGGRGGESHCGRHLDCFTPTVFAMTEVVLQGAAVAVLGYFCGYFAAKNHHLLVLLSACHYKLRNLPFHHRDLRNLSSSSS